tara:strand:+ start:1752 stop:2252 length:501 start_codon:yes stop_codon:yes gene_type:complete
MGYIAVNETAEFVKLQINADGQTYSDAATAMAVTANVMVVPAMQEITLNMTPGTFRWKQLDELSEKVVTTSSTNSLEATIVLDEDTFFKGFPVDGTGTLGIFDITNNKTEAWFRMYWQGNSTGDRYVEGRGYLTGVAPTVSPDSPVWTSPLTLEISGDLVSGVVPA